MSDDLHDNVCRIGVRKESGPDADNRSAGTKTEWATKTWNPVTGCTKHSAGCQNCYAAAMARRLKAMGQVKYAEGFTVRCHETVLDEPMHWRKPRRVFVCSMSDLFHDDVPDDFIRRVFGVIEETPQHEYQILTKRAERLAELAPRLPWPSNLWAGVTVESDHYTHRIEALRTVPAAVRFLSIEPLLGPIPGLDLRDIDWVICGGESGPNARPMHPDWVRSLRDQCAEADVPFFFKQWGEWLPDEQFCDAGIEDNPEASRFRSMVFEDGKWSDLGYPIWTDFEDYYGYQIVGRVGKKAAGRLLDGVAHDAIPEARA